MYATLAKVTNSEERIQAVILEFKEIPAKEYDFGGFEFDVNNIYLAWSVKCHNAIILRLKNEDKIYHLLYEDTVWIKIKAFLDGKRTQQIDSGT